MYIQKNLTSTYFTVHCVIRFTVCWMSRRRPCKLLRILNKPIDGDRLWYIIFLQLHFIYTYPVRHTWNLIFCFHHRWSVKFMFCMSLRHMEVYFPLFFSSQLTASNASCCQPESFRKKYIYDYVNCPWMLSSKCKSQCHVRNVYC